MKAERIQAQLDVVLDRLFLVLLLVEVLHSIARIVVLGRGNFRQEKIGKCGELTIHRPQEREVWERRLTFRKSSSSLTRPSSFALPLRTFTGE